MNVLVGEKRSFQLDTFDSLFVHVDEEVNMDSTSTSAKRTDHSPTGDKRRPVPYN